MQECERKQCAEAVIELSQCRATRGFFIGKEQAYCAGNCARKHCEGILINKEKRKMKTPTTQS